MIIGEERVMYINHIRLPGPLPLLDIAIWLSSPDRIRLISDWKFFLWAMSCCLRECTPGSIENWSEWFRHNTWQGVEPHMRAGIAAAAIEARHIDQGFLRHPLVHLMENPGLREHDETGGAAGFGVLQQFAGGADEISQVEKGLDALRVGNHLSVGMLKLQLEQRLLTEGFMNDAAPGPEGELAAALVLHPAPQVPVGSKQDRLIWRQLTHQIDRIAAGADQIALRFFLFQPQHILLLQNGYKLSLLLY